MAKKKMLFARVEMEFFDETNELAKKVSPSLSEYVRLAIQEKNDSLKPKEG